MQRLLVCGAVCATAQRWLVRDAVSATSHTHTHTCANCTYTRYNDTQTSFNVVYVKQLVAAACVLFCVDICSYDEIEVICVCDYFCLCEWGAKKV